MPQPGLLFRDAFDGPYLDVLGGRVRILFDGDATEGRHSCVSAEYDPGGHAPPHAHPAADELFHVIAGRFEFWTPGGYRSVEPGQIAYVPRGEYHGFRNVGDTVGRLVATYTPAGFERFLVEVDTLSRTGQVTGDALARLNEKYGITVTD